MKYPNPTRRDLETFCRKEGWTLQESATGKNGDHDRYELELGNGEILSTKISTPIGNKGYGPGLWSAVLGQLRVSNEEFWACAQKGNLPERPERVIVPVRVALPIQIVAQLTRLLHYTPDQIEGLSLKEATDLLNEFYSRPKPQA